MRILPILIAAMALACGSEKTRAAYYDRASGTMVHAPLEHAGIELAPAEPVEPTEGDVGQASQPLIFTRDGAGNPGIKPDSYQACAAWDSGQNCVIPDEADFIWYLYGGTSAQRTEYRAHINQRITDMINGGLDQCAQQRCWKFREATDLSDPELNYVISLSPSVSGSCPGSSDATRRFFCWGGATTGVAKASGEGLFGTYHRFADHIVPAVTIDATEIGSLPLTAAQRFNVARQVVGAVIDGAGGKGLMQIGGTRCNNVNLLDPNVACTVSAAEVCWFENFGDEGDVSTVHRIGPDCGS